MRRRRTTALTACVLVPTVLLAGCSGTDDPPADPASRSASEGASPTSAGALGTELPATWEAEVEEPPFTTSADDAAAGPNEGVDPIDAGNRLLAVGGDLVAGLDAATGARVFTLRLSAPVCATAPAADPSGTAVVLTGSDGRCADAVAIDTATGNTRWTVPIPRAAEAYGHEVHVGASTVVVTGECAGFTLLSTADGSVVDTVPGQTVDGQCASASSDGASVVMSSASELSVFDAATGRRLARTPVEGLGRVGDVLTADPLVATVAPSPGGFLADLSGPRPEFFGYEEGGSGGAPSASVRVGGSLWVQNPRSRVLQGYDLTTRTALDTIDVQEGDRLVGQLDGALVVTSGVGAGTSSGPRTGVRLVDPTDPADDQLLGLLPPPPETGQRVSWSRMIGRDLVRVWGTGDGTSRVESVELSRGPSAGTTSSTGQSGAALP